MIFSSANSSPTAIVSKKIFCSTEKEINHFWIILAFLLWWSIISSFIQFVSKLTLLVQSYSLLTNIVSSHFLTKKWKTEPIIKEVVTYFQGASHFSILFLHLKILLLENGFLMDLLVVALRMNPKEAPHINMLLMSSFILNFLSLN